MIIGHGIDIQHFATIERLMNKDHRFAERVLTKNELMLFNRYEYTQRLEFLGGRWAVKEAFAKALGTGIGNQVSFQSLEVLKNENGSPKIVQSIFDGKVWVSISHSYDYVQASVILERQ